MNGIVRRAQLGFNSLCAFIYKWMIDLHLLSIPSLNRGDEVKLVVSLTSYGRRVSKNVVYYTIVSLLRQSYLPDRIILWLAEDEWNDNIIPPKLSSLIGKGVCIRYYKNIKSYKKLIPTLSKIPTSTIITVDDDVIYSRDTIKTLVESHAKNPNDIICMAARLPIIINGTLLDYKIWPDSLLTSFEDGLFGKLLFPVGVGGVLYPQGSLHEDVLDEKAFMEYCPKADDIWFWFCGLRNNTIKRYVKKKGKDLSFDSLYQYFHRGSALTHINSLKHQNDVQLRNLLEAYQYKIQ